MSTPTLTNSFITGSHTTAAPSAPRLSPTAQALADTRSKRETTARKVWRECVAAVADGKELTKKMIEDLAAAQFDLQREPKQFDLHVAAYAAYLRDTRMLAKELTHEQHQQERKRLEARNREIEVEQKRLLDEHRENVRLHGNVGMNRHACEIRIGEVMRNHPELFAAD